MALFIPCLGIAPDITPASAPCSGCGCEPDAMTTVAGKWVCNDCEDDAMAKHDAELEHYVDWATRLFYTWPETF